MATFTDSGAGGNFLGLAFETRLLFPDLVLVTATDTEVVLHNLLQQSFTILTGTGLATDTGQISAEGMVTAFEIRSQNGNDSTTVFAATGISWNAVSLISAGRDYSSTGNETLIRELLSLQPVTYDARDAVAGVEFNFQGVTSDLTLLGSDFNDTLRGGRGDDTIRGGDGDDMIQPGGNTGDDLIDAGTGFDTIDFSLGSGDSRDSRYILSHRSLADRTGIVATIFNNDYTTPTINKGNFGQTQLAGVSTATFAFGGLSIEGTGLDDRFYISLDYGFVGLTPGRGSDTVQAVEFGHVGLDFGTDSNGIAATQGAVVNLVTGIVANDGFGFADRLIIGTGVDVSVTLTESADTLVAVGRPGTLRGGGGTDTLDYGKDTINDQVDVDLGAGRVVLVGGGIQTIESFENLVGTRHGDRLLGTTGANVIEGRGGSHDTIMGDGFRAGYALVPALQVWRLYQAMLDRAPDTAEQYALTAQMLRLGGLLRVRADDLSTSTEFQNTYGGLDNTAFVTLLYHNVLDRAPDAGGLADWLYRIGGFGESRAQVVLGFSESREFVNRTLAEANAFTAARIEANWTDDVYRLYRATLDRDPDAAGFLDWQGRLGNGTAFLTVVEGFAGSAEFQRTYGALDDAAFVTLLYENVLDRAPDAGGQADWLGRLAGGATRAEVVSGFSQSREFVRATAEAVVTFVRGLEGGDTLDAGGGFGDLGGGSFSYLWGGNLADEFVFDADQPAHHQVNDFEAWDYLTFRDFGYDDAGDVRSHMAQSLANVVFQDQGVTVTLLNLQLAAITDDMFLFS